MSLDELSTAAPELETATEPAASETSPNEIIELDGAAEGQGPDDGGNMDGEGQNAPMQDDGLADVEYEGKSYKIPLELKDALLRQQDYTRKTQEVSASRRDLEAKAAEIEQRSKASDEELNARATLIGIRNELSELGKLDFQKMQQEDPFGAQGQFMRYQQLREAETQLTGFLNEAQRVRTENTERETANRLQATAEYARTKLPGWNEELDVKINNFAMQELGFSQDTLRQACSPEIYRTLFLAHLGHQVLSKQAAPKAAFPTPQPLQTVTPKGGTVRKTAAQMSVAEMSAYLNKRS